MRNLLSILFFVCCTAVFAEEFTVFEKDGYFGIKDRTGNVTVPAVYEKLGWSNGSIRVYNGVIGFRENNLWGLITVRNKALTGQKFYTIEPLLLPSSHFKASIKGRFSNHLFYGVLDEKGRTLISFNYFTIEPIGVNWLVSDFDMKRQQFGVVSFVNELIIPTKYVSVNENHGLLVGRQHGQKLDLYRTNGQLLQLDLDSISYQNGWIAYRDGYAGYLSGTGNVVHEFDYKTFSFDGETIPEPFPEWTVYQQDSVLLKWQCDSLTVSKNGMLVAYLNGANHLLLKNSTLLGNHELILKEVSNNQMIVQNTKTRKWSVLREDGINVITGYDSIHATGNYYGCLDAKGWHLINRNGSVRNRFSLQELKPGLDKQFVTKRNNYWGIFKLDAEEATIHKYDSIITTDNEYLVSYLNRWGVLDENEEWIIRSEFNEVNSLGNLLIGQKGKGYTIFYDGKALYKIAFKPVSVLGTHVLIQDNNSKYGLINRYGKMTVMPIYDSIRMWNDHIEFARNGEISLMTPSGQLILKAEESYQAVGGYGEGYFLVKKEHRWGFVDDKGRLRISNRYDDGCPFNEGLAPIKLRGKWGFIDKTELIRIQPYYHSVSPFINGRAIVRLNQRFGLVDENGKEVLALDWKAIHRLNTDNYIVQDIDNRIGLVNEAGSFVFRPSFDYLEDFGDRVLVSKNGDWGVLNYSGQPIFKINHEEVKVTGKFTMIKN